MLCSVRRPVLLLPCCYVPSGGHADGHGGVSAQTCHTLVHSVHRCFMLAMVISTSWQAVPSSGHSSSTSLGQAVLPAVTGISFWHGFSIRACFWCFCPKMPHLNYASAPLCFCDVCREAP